MPAAERIKRRNTAVVDDLSAAETMKRRNIAVRGELPAAETMKRRNAAVAGDLPAKERIKRRNTAVAGDLPATEHIKRRNIAVAGELPATKTIKRRNAAVAESNRQQITKKVNQFLRRFYEKENQEGNVFLHERASITNNYFIEKSLVVLSQQTLLDKISAKLYIDLLFFQLSSLVRELHGRGVVLNI